MKAGQNNKYDITKAPGLQVCLKSGVARSSNVVVIICPPDWDKVNWFVEIMGGGISPSPLPVPTALFGVGKEEEKESDYIIKSKNIPKGGGQNHLKSF